MDERKMARAALLATVSAALLGGASLAQTTTAADAPDPGAPTVTISIDVKATVPVDASVATRQPLPLLRIPAAVSVVSRPLFGEQDGRTVSDALRNVAGLNIQSQAGTTDFFLIRGFDSVSSGLVLTDGVPEPEASRYHLYNVDRVETLKGPAGFIYGGNPLAGVVDLVHKRPHSGRSGQAALRAGSFGTRGAAFDVNSGYAESGTRVLGFRVNGLYSESSGYRDDKDSRSWAIDPVLTWSPGPGTQLTADLEYVDNQASPDAGLPLVSAGVPDVSRRQSYQSPFDRSSQQLGRGRVDLAQQLGSRISLLARTYYNSLDWQSDGTLFNGVFPSVEGDEAQRTLVLLDDRQRFFGEQLDATTSFETGKVLHQLLFGLELEQQRDEFGFDVALLPGMRVYDPVETATRPLYILPGVGGAGDATSRIYAPYLLDRLIIGEHLELQVGARFDRVDYEDTVARVAVDDSHLSPLLGVTWMPTNGWAVYANLAEGFAPPSSLVREDRKFEESRGIEAGIKRLSGTGRFSFTLAGFSLERDNIGIPDDTGFTQQAGDQRSRGVELEAQATPGQGWRLAASYAYTDAELVRFSERVLTFPPPYYQPTYVTVDRSGNRPAFAPEHLANLWLSKAFANGLGAAMGARYVGRQMIAEDNAFAIPSALTFDAAVSYAVNEQLRVRLNLRNLTDETTFQRGFGSASVIPDDPRSAVASVEWTM
jgi:TonB-dependent siderophore receptor